MNECAVLRSWFVRTSRLREMIAADDTLEGTVFCRSAGGTFNKELPEGVPEAC
jgi:hypothetical protein